MKDNTAFRKGEPPSMVVFPDFSKDGRLKIPKKMLEEAGINKPEELAIWNNKNKFVSLASNEPGYTPPTVDVEESDSCYLVKVTDDMDAIKPLNTVNRHPVALLGCGEIWIFSHNDFWDKIAAEVE